MDPEPFVKMCQTLRVLNAVRVNVIGLPITYTQYPLFYVLFELFESFMDLYFQNIF